MKDLVKALFAAAALSAAILSGCQSPSQAEQPPQAAFVLTPAANVAVGERVSFDASGSSDPQGYALAYAWTLGAPAGSSAALGPADQKTANFSPDVAGIYSIGLVVTAKGRSGTASRTVTAHMNTVIAPLFDHPAGIYAADIAVSLSTATSGAEVHYTTNGDLPTELSPILGAAIPVAGDGAKLTIKAMATKAGMADSSQVAAAYEIDYAAVTMPTFSPPPGSFSADQAVALACATSGAEIHYTTNGDLPTTLSPIYGASIRVAGNTTSMTIKAIASKAGMRASSQAIGAYSILYPPAAAPSFSPPGGGYQADQSVTISCATAGATIHYTTDGRDPTPSSPIFSGSPIAAAGNGSALTIKAFAAKAGMSLSPIAQASYFIAYPTLPDPTFSIAGGSYSTDQAVTLSATSGATIYFTTDSSDPSTASAVYSGSPIAVSGNGTTKTIKAIATKPGMTQSAIASATYTIDSGITIYSQPASGAATFYQSSWADPNGTDADEYVYDDFTLASDANISQVLWRGGYIHDRMYGSYVWNFTITFYASIAGGSQPQLTNPQLPEIYLAFYDLGGSFSAPSNANETSVAGTPFYDYAYTLPTPFHATAGTKYWIRIQAAQGPWPDWGIADATGGDGTHFMFNTGAARFFAPAGDGAFTLR
jgi:hypothetical protein